MQIAITEVVTEDEYDIRLVGSGAERRRSERGAGRRKKVSSRHDDLDKPICFNTFSDGSFDDGSAQHRRGESFRLALGATNENIVRAAAVPGNLLSVAGIGAGLILFAARLLKSLLWGVSATDSVAFVVVALLLIAVTGLSSIIPALRLACLDPAQTLRNE
jgi:hypothetical protein